MATEKTTTYIKYNEFDVDNMKDFDFNGKWDVSGSKNPDSFQILMEYNYGNKDSYETSRLKIKMPQLSTSRGITDHKEFIGKPAIAVRFDMKNTEHATFVGKFGTKYEYDRRGRHVSEDLVPSTGVLSQLYDWSIRSYGRHLAKRDGRNPDDADDADYFEATKQISKDMFYYRRKYTAVDEKSGKGKKGELIPDADPMKFFKLLSYTGLDDSGNPLPTKYTNFMMPNGTKVDITDLYGRGFEFTGVLSFRRIYIGARKSVTMELTDVLIHKFYVNEQGISKVLGRLLTENMEENPDEADSVAKQYEEMKGSVRIASDFQHESKCSDVDVFKTKDSEQIEIDESSDDESSHRRRTRRDLEVSD